MKSIEQENLRVAKHALSVIAGYGPETGTTLMQLTAREGLRIIEANEARARMETRIEEAVAVCSACGVSGSGGLASGGSTVTIRCNKPYCPGGTSANRRDSHD